MNDVRSTPRAYETPSLKSLGSFSELTLGSSQGTQADAPFSVGDFVTFLS